MERPSTFADGPKSGKVVRLRSLQPGELPAHPLLPNASGSPPDLATFLSNAFEEGYTLSELNNFRSKTMKHSPPAKAQVAIQSKEEIPGDIPVDRRDQYTREYWFARTSKHVNSATDGTASWNEFDAGLRVDHSKHEQEYTPNLVEAHEVLSYREQLQEIHQQVGKWREVTFNVMEMVHKVPFPLAKRVFSVLVITGKADEEFLVVQIPVDLGEIKESKFRNDSSIVHGIYTSVERCTLRGQENEIEWITATASDAKGVLPMSIQKLAMPGALAIDVGLFIDWTTKRRKAQADQAIIARMDGAIERLQSKNSSEPRQDSGTGRFSFLSFRSRQSQQRRDRSLSVLWHGKSRTDAA